MSSAISSFAALIAPLTPETFLAEHWEKTYLHLSRNQPGLFDELFSLEDVDRWLRSTKVSHPDGVLTTPPEGSEGGTRTQRYRPQDLRIEDLYESFAKGHSLVLNYLEDSWPPLFGLVEALGRAFAARIGVNSYLTPKGSRTLSIHTDDHDVFVLQVQGEKVWRLHELRNLSVMRLDYKQDLAFTPEWGESRLEGPLLAELTLRPGDLLYVPRGMPHCAVAQDATSLHLTIAVTPLYWIDLLKAAVEQAAVRAPLLRRALPVGFVEHAEALAAMRREFPAVLRAFQEALSFDEAADVLTRNRVRLQGYPQDGHFVHLNALGSLGPDSQLERREGVLCTVLRGGDESSILCFGARQLRGPARFRQAFEFIRDTDRFRVAEIPGLSEQNRLTTARRLIREGLLRFAAAGPG